MFELWFWQYIFVAWLRFELPGEVGDIFPKHPFDVIFLSTEIWQPLEPVVINCCAWKHIKKLIVNLLMLEDKPAHYIIIES